MGDIYLYNDCSVLKNLLDIKDQKLLDEAEADYVTYRLKEIAIHPLPGGYNLGHLLQMHQYLFQDIYEWAGQPRRLNIYKEEPVLGGLSIEYSDTVNIPRDVKPRQESTNRESWGIMRNRINQGFTSPTKSQ